MTLCFRFSDIFVLGFHTTTYAAILYASSVLSMSAPKIIFIGILVQLAAVISSILVPRVQRRLSITSSKPVTNYKVLLAAVVAAAFIPVYTCVGLVLPFGGLRSEGEMYVLAVWFGLVSTLDPSNVSKLYLWLTKDRYLDHS